MEAMLEVLKAQSLAIAKQNEALTKQNQDITDLKQIVHDLASNLHTGLATTSSVAPHVPRDTDLVAKLSQRIKMFSFDVESDRSFSEWFDRYNPIIANEGSSLKEETKVRLVLEKLEDSAYARLKSEVQPKKPSELSFKELVDTLKLMFDVPISMVTERYKCRLLEKGAHEDIGTYTAKVNEQCECAIEGDGIRKDDFKNLCWIMGLNSPSDSEYRIRLLAFLDKKHIESKKNSAIPNATVLDLKTEYSRMTVLWKEAKMLEQPLVKGVQKHKPFKQNVSKPFPSGVTCFNCGIQGHRSTECRSKKTSCQKCGNSHMTKFCKRPRNVSIIHAQTQPLAAIQVVRSLLDVPVNGINIRFQVDTGADITLVSESDWKSLGKPTLEKSEYTVRDASGNAMSIMGKFKCKFELKGSFGEAFAHVSPMESLLGLDWIHKSDHMSYHLSKMVNKIEHPVQDEGLVDVLKSRYPTIFAEGLGTCQKQVAELQLRPGVVPICRKCRPIPHAAREAVEEELERLLKLEVIEPITHAEWAAPVVVVKKPNGKLRICTDFSTGLNNALVDYEYPLPLPEDIFASLDGGVVFSQIDFSDAYLQVPLSEDARELVVMNTHKGFY